MARTQQGSGAELPGAAWCTKPGLCHQHVTAIETTCPVCACTCASVCTSLPRVVENLVGRDSPGSMRRNVSGEHVPGSFRCPFSNCLKLL